MPVRKNKFEKFARIFSRQHFQMQVILAFKGLHSNKEKKVTFIVKSIQTKSVVNKLIQSINK